MLSKRAGTYAFLKYSNENYEGSYFLIIIKAAVLTSTSNISYWPDIPHSSLAT